MNLLLFVKRKCWMKSQYTVIERPPISVLCFVTNKTVVIGFDLTIEVTNIIYVTVP